MAITITQERKKQRYLILAFSLIIFVAVFVFWQGFFRGKKEAPDALGSAAVYAPPKIDIDWKFLENFSAKSAPPLKEISEFEGEFGRKNPFVPF